MSLFVRNRQFLLVATLATLALRALAPDGYMPGSADSGLLYELCPEGMPVEIMQALAGDNQHHHHHGDDGEATSASGSEQCPIGHMLASAIAMDSLRRPICCPTHRHMTTPRSQYCSARPPSAIGPAHHPPELHLPKPFQIARYQLRNRVLFRRTQ